MAHEIEIIGDGTVMIANISRNGRKGLLIRKTTEKSEVGSKVKTEHTKHMIFIPEDDDVIIWVDSIESMRVIQDRINIMSLVLNGYEVTNSEFHIYNPQISRG